MGKVPIKIISLIPPIATLLTSKRRLREVKQLPPDHRQAAASSYLNVGPLSSSLCPSLRLQLRGAERLAGSHITSNVNTGSCRTLQPPRGSPIHTLARASPCNTTQAVGVSARLAKGSLAICDQACLHSASHEKCWERCPSWSPPQTVTVGRNTGWDGK